jgi:hypothetical protein
MTRFGSTTLFCALLDLRYLFSEGPLLLFSIPADLPPSAVLVEIRRTVELVLLTAQSDKPSSVTKFAQD